MIQLTRLGGDVLLVNAELLKYVESLPDTYLTLTTGDRLVVVESPDEVLRRVIEYHRSKHLLPSPNAI
jgi:flagellar protein FlbD